MEDQLLEISPSDWKKWRDLYKTDWPRHEVSFNLIQNYIDWQEQGVDLKELVAYSLNGEWAKDGTYIVIDRSEMFMYSLDSTLAGLRRALMLVDWNRSYLVNMGLYRSLVIEIYQMFNMEVIFDKHTFIYYVPHENARKLDVVIPAGFKFAPLKPVDAVFINSEWPHKYPGSEAFVERLIRRNVNMGLFDASGKLMAWCMRVQNGAIGMLGVAHPRRGYGSMMALGFARKLGELGHNSYASVIATNEPSRRMFDKLGFQTSSHRKTSRYASRRHEEGSRRSRSAERYHRIRRNRRSRSDASDRYRYSSASRSPDRGHSSRRTSVSFSAKIRVDSPDPSRCLGVFGLSVYTTEPYLKDIFCQYGTVEKVFVVYDAKTRQSRGFGFVYFQTVLEASLARKHCNGLEFHGRRIRVDYSITEQPHPPTSGTYMDRREGSRSPSPREYSRQERRHRHYRS